MVFLAFKLNYLAKMLRLLITVFILFIYHFPNPPIFVPFKIEIIKLKRIPPVLFYFFRFLLLWNCRHSACQN